MHLPHHRTAAGDHRYRTRRTFATVLALLVLVLCETGCRSGGGESVERGGRPNILWLVAEDMSAALGSYGDAFANTPHLDALARAGVRYTRAFATAPACSPARSTLITGVYATSTGTMGLRSSFPLPDRFRGFPSFLREAGYYTTNNVKTDYNTRDEPRLIAESWDDSSETAHWRGRTSSAQPFFAVFNFMHTHQTRISFLDEEWPEIADAVGMHDPAGVPVPPYYPDDPDVRRTLARYYDAVHAMDAEAGRILHQLDEDGLADHTIVFFYTDHGMGLPRGKRTLYDTGLHVPLIVRFPGKYRHLAPAPAGETVDRLVSFVDFPPTVLSIAGLPVPDHMQGRAFLGGDMQKAPEYVHGARDRVDEAFDISRSIRDDRYLYIRNYVPHLSWNAPEGFSDMAPIRQSITRLARQGRLDGAQLTYAGPTKPVEELFDTLEDRDQLHNLAASAAHRDVLERMRSALRERAMQMHDIGFAPEGELARRIAGSTTPWDVGRNGSGYPLARVLAAADLVGRSGAVATQIELLRDDDPVIRYWAAVGLRAAGDAGATALPALRQALNDPTPEVRIQAADALARLDAADRAVATLAEALASDEPYVVLLAARTLQLLGPKARPARPAMERVLAVAQDDRAYDGLGMYVRFALEPALATMSGTAGLRR